VSDVHILVSDMQKLAAFWLRQTKALIRLSSSTRFLKIPKLQVEKMKHFIVSLLTLCLFVVNGFAASPAVVNSNHSYAEVRIGYAKSDLSDCSFQYSPVDFCDTHHIAAYNQVLRTRKPDFNKTFILLAYSERREYHQRSIVAIDSKTGTVYPLPIDAFSGFMHGRSDAKDDGRLDYSLDHNKICVSGAILVYRAFEQGHFCFELEGDKFVGHHTEYMYP
jgi:hypothetical protein